MSEYDKFVETFINHASNATGMTREELLKGWSVNDMKKYNPDATCVKCGSGEIETAYRKAYNPGDNPFYEKLCTLLDNEPSGPAPELIPRTCKNCGYQWDEAPLDGEEDLPPFKEVIPDDLEEGQRIMDEADSKMGKLNAEARELNDSWDRSMGRSVSDTSVIEVGDTVKATSRLCNLKGECEVMGIQPKSEVLEAVNIRNNTARLMNPDDRMCSCVVNLDNLTPIRKGPKVHRFEGVRIEAGVKDGHRYLVWDEQNKIIPYIHNNKVNGTFTLTLTEENSP